MQNCTKETQTSSMASKLKTGGRLDFVTDAVSAVTESLDLASLPCRSNRWLWIGAPQLSHLRFKDWQSAGVSSWTTPEWNPVKALTGFHSAVVQEAVVRKRSTMLRLLKQKRSTSSTWREHLRSEETHKVISETSKLGLPDATTECDERMQWWDAMMCIPSRTPVSSGLRSTKAFFKWNITPTHPDPTDVILAIRRDTQEILWNLATWADDVFTNGCCKLACNDALGQKRRRHVDLQFSKCSKT